MKKSKCIDKGLCKGFSAIHLDFTDTDLLVLFQIYYSAKLDFEYLKEADQDLYLSIYPASHAFFQKIDAYFDGLPPYAQEIRHRVWDMLQGAENGNT